MYVAMNRFRVNEGFEDGFEQIWRDREKLVTRGWRRLKEVQGQEIPIIEYPLPEVLSEIRRRAL